MSKEEENAYYAAMIAQIDHDINVKNGVAQVHIPDPPKGKR